MTANRCAHCAREFSRHEHLVRHERTHTKEKPYQCFMCTQAFARRDLLRRHEIKAHNYHVRRSSNSIPSTIPKPQIPAAGSFQDVSSGLNANNLNQLWPPQSRPQASSIMPVEMDIQSSLLQDYLLPDATQWLETLDTVEGTFTGNLDLRGEFDSPESDQAAATCSVNPALREQRSILSHPGSPPIPPTPNNTTSGDSVKQMSLEISEERWKSIRLEVSQRNPTFCLPKRQSMSRFIRRYFRSFHRHQPILHEPTWCPSQSQTSLILAVCANGAIYSLERAAALEMHSLAVDMLTPDDGQLETVQAMMLLGAFSAWDDPLSTFDTTLKLQGYLTLAIRKIWTDADINRSLPDSSSWERWKAEESLKRSAYCVFTLMSLMTIAFNIPSPFLLEDRHGLPAHESLWNSASESEWLQAKSNVPPQQWHSAQAVLDRLGTEYLPVPSNLGMFGCHVLILYLVQKIILFRRSCTRDTPGFQDTQSYFLQLLKRWQIMWENEPESTLSPENPHGPILFNCTAILRVAYIRLVSDYSLVRETFSFCSEYQMAKTLEAMETPRREPETTRAVLQACLALQIPAQLGFKVVARTGFWVWSVQHALSYFECAIFLSKWCQGVASDNDLSDDEMSVLNLVEQVIGSTGGDSGTDDMSLPLHAVVLRRWAELLDTGGTTVWKIMPQMANALRTYANMLTSH